MFQYINGGSLEQLVQSPEPLTWCTRTRLGLDMAQALTYLHGQQVFPPRPHQQGRTLHHDLTGKERPCTMISFTSNRYDLSVPTLPRMDDGKLTGKAWPYTPASPEK